MVSKNLTSIQVSFSTKKILDDRYKAIVLAKHDEDTAKFLAKKSSYETKLKTILELSTGDKIR